MLKWWAVLATGCRLIFPLAAGSRGADGHTDQQTEGGGDDADDDENNTLISRRGADGHTDQQTERGGDDDYKVVLMRMATTNEHRNMQGGDDDDKRGADGHPDQLPEGRDDDTDQQGVDDDENKRETH